MRLDFWLFWLVGLAIFLVDSMELSARLIEVFDRSHIVLFVLLGYSASIPIDSIEQRKEWQARQERMSTDGMHESIIFNVFPNFVRSHCYWFQRPNEIQKTSRSLNWTKLTFFFLRILCSPKYFATFITTISFYTLATHIPYPTSTRTRYSTKRSRIFEHFVVNFSELSFSRFKHLFKENFNWIRKCVKTNFDKSTGFLCVCVLKPSDGFFHASLLL